MGNDFCNFHAAFEERFKLLCVKIEALERLVNVQINTAKDSLNLAREELNTRLHLMNNLQSRLDTLANQLATKDEVKLEIKKIEEKIALLLAPINARIEKYDNHISQEMGQTGVKVVVVTAIIAVLVSVTSFLVIHYAFRL